mgnify:FL=1|jgi:hypothetical protein
MLLAAGLAGCGELPRPFQPEFKGETNTLLMPADRAGMVIEPIAGLPDSADFAERLAESLRWEGIVAMTGRGNAQSLRLSGEAAAVSGGWDVHLTLNDAKGTALGALVRTLPPEITPPQMAELARAVGLVLYPDGPVPIAPKPSVSIGAVAGVPGEGGRALARALEFQLKRADVKLADTPTQATHIINAVVTFAPAKGTPPNDTRNIDVRWVVVRADRQEVGQVRQANDVPSRDLDRNWAEIAHAVADAAVEGLTNLLQRAPPASR